MAIIKNKEAQASTNIQSENKVFSGLANFTILAVNPSNKVLKDSGFYVKDGAEEPEYVTENRNGKTKIKLTVIGKASTKIGEELVEAPLKKIFWLEDEPVVKKDDATAFQFINQLWRTQYAKSAEEAVAINREMIERKTAEKGKSYEWMSIGTNLRKSFIGERELMEFTGKANNVLNVLENDCTFDSKPFTKEWIKEIEKALVGNTVKVVVGIAEDEEKKGKQYMNILGDKFIESFLYTKDTPSNYFITQFNKTLEGGKSIVQHPNLKPMFYSQEAIVNNPTNNGNSQSSAADALPF